MTVWTTCFFRFVGFLFFLFVIGSGTITAQQQKLQKLELADEYFRRNNFEKALQIYEDLKGDLETDRKMFRQYLTCLDSLKPKKADDASRKFLKRYPEDVVFFANHYKRLIGQTGKRNEASKFAETKLRPFYLQHPEAAGEGFIFLSESGDSAQASKLLDASIEKFGIGQFWELRLEQFLRMKQHKQAADFVLKLLSSAGEPFYDQMKQLNDKQLYQYLANGPSENPLDLQNIQARLQEKISITSFSRELQAGLLRKIQQEPSKEAYPDFLAWIYLQKGDYEGALTQYLALDKLKNSNGILCYQLGEAARNVSKNKEAIRCYETVIREFPTSPNRFLSQQRCLQLKEEVVKNTFPVQKDDVRQLIGDYRALTNSRYLNIYELTMKIAELYGKYLNRPDSAILELETSMKKLLWQASYRNQAKVLLADMYVLKDDPWEASLLYGQVESEEAESLTGYEAKLKNAKVFYFKGEFDLCKEILDVIKQSTNRDISNDAIELGLLLQDMLAEDTTGFILSKFAEIDLLAYQGNFPESIDRIEKLLFTSSNPVVTEKLRFRLFRNYQAMRQFDKALSELDQIYKAKASDLYLDDALYFSGIIYAEQKNDKDKAMEYFLNLIKEKPGSVYVSDARRRLRMLRGDFAN